MTKVYGIYQHEHDITFVMRETVDEYNAVIELSVIGFYYGEPDEELNELYNGKTTAKFSF